jgi:hypothetical protein
MAVCNLSATQQRACAEMPQCDRVSVLEGLRCTARAARIAIISLARSLGRLRDSVAHPSGTTDHSSGGRRFLCGFALNTISSAPCPVHVRLRRQVETARGLPSHLFPRRISPTILCYRGSIMKKREGTTEKISISLSRSDLASLKKRAKRLYSGNVSAVISELAADAALLEGMHELVTWLGGPSLTDRERRAIDREWSGRARATKRARKNMTAA